MFTVNYAGNYTTKCFRPAASGVLCGIIRREQGVRISPDHIAVFASAFIDMATREYFTFSVGRQNEVHNALRTSSARDQLSAALMDAIHETERITSDNPFQIGVNNAARDILNEFMTLFGLKGTKELVTT